MASLETRQAIKAAVEVAAAPLLVYDLSDYVTMEDILSDIDSEAVLLQFVASGERVASIGGEGNQGWEEDGTAVLHLMVPSGFDSYPTIGKGDAIREALRGQRVSDKVTVEACEPFVDFGAGSSGLYGAAWHGFASNLFYVRRDCG